MLRTLFVAPQLPWPLDVGSRIRAYQLLKSYAELGPVTLVCLGQDAADSQPAPQLEAIVEAIQVVPLRGASAPRAGGKLAALRQLLDCQPRIIREFHSPELAAKVEALLAGGNIDILHVERLFMAQGLTAVARRHASSRQVLQVLDIDDFESAKLWRTLTLEPWLRARKYLHLLEYLKLRRYERRIFPAFDLALVCSRRDMARIGRRGAAPAARVFSNGADVDDSIRPSIDDGRTLAFFGAMNYHPNEDAAVFFIESVLPLIRRKVPDVRFVVAGKSPPAAILSRHDGHSIVVQGYVEEKNALFDACTVFVVPIRIGGGTRIKILEAMAAGKAVVSTTVGCEGLEMTPGRELLVADTPVAFAEACVQLLGRAVERQAIAGAGRAAVTRQYRWRSIRQDFVNSLRNRGVQTS